MKLAWLLSALTLSGTLACARHDAPTPSPAPARQTARSSVDTPRAQSASPSTTRTDTASIYDLSVGLTDENGGKKPLASLRGRTVLITMFYGSCPSACPLLTSDLKRIERQIPEPVRSNVRVVMVSFDAARDTPAVLTRLKRERAVDSQRWTFASMSDEEARELGGVLGIRYRKLDNGEFFHSSVIVLLDAEGRPQARVDGISGDPSAILAALITPST